MPYRNMAPAIEEALHANILTPDEAPRVLHHCNACNGLPSYTIPAIDYPAFKRFLEWAAEEHRYSLQ